MGIDRLRCPRAMQLRLVIASKWLVPHRDRPSTRLDQILIDAGHRSRADRSNLAVRCIRAMIPGLNEGRIG